MEMKTMTKAELREFVASQRRSMGLPIIDASGYVALKRMKRHEAYLSAKKVGVYAPLPDEIDITRIMAPSEQTFYIPALDEACGEYRLAEMHETFKRNRFGGVEPIDPIFAEKDEIDLIVIPGFAFSYSGERLGREEDYYNELVLHYNALKVGICLDFQCMPEIPFDEDDLRVDYIFTESKGLQIIEE
jgi:5-formyltetrahydrofolate cyclo-ligase